MCKYCEKYSVPRQNLELGDIFILQGAQYTFVGDGKPYSIPLNYCPSCGEKLIKHSSRGKSIYKSPFPVANNVSVGSIVITQRCLDIGFVAEATNGRPSKIISRYNEYHIPYGEFPLFGGIEMVDWYDTGIRMSLEEWKDLSDKYDAEGFYDYWRTRLQTKG